MKFDIARQPFVPAFLTLLIVAWVWVSHFDPTLTASAYPFACPKTDQGLMFCLPNALLAAFSLTHPVWTKVVSVCLLLFTGASIGRMTLRYNLYSVGTCLSIPLMLILALLIGCEGLNLVSILGMMLFALAIKNYGRSFKNGYTFDANFRAAMYVGMLVSLMPATILLVLIVPLALFMFHRTVREAVVSLFGLVLFPLVLCYVNWGMGGAFFAPVLVGAEQVIESLPLANFVGLSVVQYLGFALVLVLDIVGVYTFLTNLYSVGTKPRFILLYTVVVFFVLLVLLFVPSASSREMVLWAVPSSILLPAFLIRLPRFFSGMIYCILLVLSLGRLFFG